MWPEAGGLTTSPSCFNCNYIDILQGIEPHPFWVGIRHFWFPVEDPTEVTGAHLINPAWHPRAKISGKEVTRLGWKIGNSILRRNWELVSEVARRRGWKCDCGRQSSKEVTPADTYQALDPSERNYVASYTWKPNECNDELFFQQYRVEPRQQQAPAPSKARNQVLDRVTKYVKYRRKKQRLLGLTRRIQQKRKLPCSLWATYIASVIFRLACSLCALIRKGRCVSWYTSCAVGL